jgi:hypothetical protein
MMVWKCPRCSAEMPSGLYRCNNCHSPRPPEATLVPGGPTTPGQGRAWWAVIGGVPLAFIGGALLFGAWYNSATGAEITLAEVVPALLLIVVGAAGIVLGLRRPRDN